MASGTLSGPGVLEEAVVGGPRWTGPQCGSPCHLVTLRTGSDEQGQAELSLRSLTALLPSRPCASLDSEAPTAEAWPRARRLG